MSVSVPFGVDFGNFHSVLAVARNRGIDIVVNEVSNRSTPSLVGFGMRNRFLGESAKSNEMSNLKNTVGSLQRLLGARSNDPAIANEKQFVRAEITDVNGEVGVKVRFAGEQKTFSSTQLAAMYFNKLKQTAHHETKGTINDVCIAVPAWYTEHQRRAAIDAAHVAGLNAVRVVNNVTAAAVGYGVFKTDLPEDEPRKVAIVDVGHASVTVSVCAFKKGELKVLGTAWNKDFGGRNIDLAIAQHFVEVIKDKYKMDVTENAKAFARVFTAAERLKKVLSANSAAPFNVESVMNDVDVSASMTREELEEYLKPYLEQLDKPIADALAQAGLSAADLDAVEVLGGTSRVPCVKEKLSQVFGKQLSFTMNQDEAVARGAAFICAMHSPTVRVRPFKFEDVNQYSVTFSWDKIEGEDVSELEVFTRGSSYPNTKVITLFRSEDLALEARYTDVKQLPAGTDSWLGRWAIKGVKPSSTGEPVAVKIKLRQDPSGLYTVDGAYTAEEIEVEEPVETSSASATPAQTPAPEGADTPQPETRTVKKWVKRDVLNIVHSYSGIDEMSRANLLELEGQMAAEDRLVAETEDRKNALEEYIYEIRGKIDDQYAEFANDDEKAKVRSLADAAEEWLYGDGEDATKAQYIAKYEELASIGNLIRGRYLAKIEEEKQAKLAAQEAEKMRAMAEKMAEQKAQREAAAAQEAASKANDAAASEDVEVPDAPQQ